MARQLVPLVSLGLGLALAVGCDDDKPPAECRREAEALQALLRSVDTDPWLLSIDDGFQLVERTDLPDTTTLRAPVIVVGERETVFEGRPVLGADELSERLAEVQAGRAALAREPGGPPGTDLVYLQIDARARWQRVVEAWSAARAAGLRAPAFVFRAPSTVTPPPRAPIDDQLDALLHDGDPSNRATGFARLIEQEVERCPALVRSFGSVATTGTESKSKRLIDELAPALIECKCRVSLPNLRSALWRLLANPHPTRVLALDPAPPTSTIRLPAAMTWAEAASRFTPDVRSAELAVAE